MMRYATSYALASVSVGLLALGINALNFDWDPFDQAAKFAAFAGWAYFLWRVSWWLHPSPDRRVAELNRGIHSGLAWILVGLATIYSAARVLAPNGLDSSDVTRIELAALKSVLPATSSGSATYILVNGEDPSVAMLEFLAQSNSSTVLKPFSSHPNPDVCLAPHRWSMFGCDSRGYRIGVAGAYYPFWGIAKIRWSTGSCAGDTLLAEVFGNWKVVTRWTSMCWTSIEDTKSDQK